MAHPSVHVIPPLILIGIPILLVALVIARCSSFYRGHVDREIAGARYHAIDGLRGYLALGVAFHHVFLNYQYYQSGEWDLFGSGLGVFLGQGAVAVFFMITAFLFWNRAIDENGHLDAYRFYISRVRRIVPMYLVAAALVIVTAFLITGFTLQVSLAELSRSLLDWILFTFASPLPINGLARTWLINTVFWSLVWEWKFYLVLPFLAIFSGPRYRWYLVALTTGIILLFDEHSLAWFFLCGALAAMIVRWPLVQSLARTWGASVVSVAAVVAAVTYTPTPYGPTGATLLLIPFVAISVGNSLFGILTCRPARLLGILSYSVYLLHNWVLFVVALVVNAYIPIKGMSQSSYWIVGAAVVLITVLLSSMTYRFVESPFLKTKKVGRPSGLESLYGSAQVRDITR